VSVVHVRGLVRKYDGRIAVDQLDLDVQAGECVAMLGPNGAGKTTTVEILEGFRRRDSGEVSVLGVDPATASKKWRQQIGIVLQDAADLGEAKVHEALRHFSHFYEHPRTVQEAIELVGLEGQSNQRIGTLSGGQRRRLDVALGVIGRPELLFLDEPTTGFDPEARHVFWALVERLKTDGVTIVLTTHYLEEADALADRVVVIAKGRKVADTSPEELGGRDSDLVTVRWFEDGATHSEQTSSPTEAVGRLSARFAGEVPGLEVVRASLEQAYLNLLERQVEQ
jgi:ABC-2 type transport system ATP-binding protein